MKLGRRVVRGEGRGVGEDCKGGEGGGKGLRCWNGVPEPNVDTLVPRTGNAEHLGKTRNTLQHNIETSKRRNTQRHS